MTLSSVFFHNVLDFFRCCRAAIKQTSENNDVRSKQLLILIYSDMLWIYFSSMFHFYTSWKSQKISGAKFGEIGLTIEIEERERVWTPNFSFKNHNECGLLWFEPWCAVSNVQAQFLVSGLMRAVCLYLKNSINLHENSKLTMLFW